MKLSEQLSKLSDDVNICLGASERFLYIAPKDEMIGYLSENILATSLWNDALAEDKKKGRRLNEEPKKPYLDRDVERCEWNDKPHNGYIVIIKGDEKGQYSLRSDITGEMPNKTLEHVDPEAAKTLISEVLAEFVNDIADEKAFREYYCDGELSERGQLLSKAKRKKRCEAENFFMDEQMLVKWTDVDGQWLMNQSDKKKEVIMGEIDKKLAKDSLSQKFYKMYDKETRAYIIDATPAGTDPSEILEKVGRGKNGSATEQDIEGAIERYEIAKKAERRKYLQSLNLKPDKPLRDQMEFSNVRANAWLKEHERRKNLLEQLGGKKSI